MEDNINIGVQVGGKDNCDICNSYRVGVKIGTGTYKDDFVCWDCIDSFINRITRKIEEKTSDGEVFGKLHEKKDIIQSIDEMVSDPYPKRNGVFKDLADIYEDLFKNGITSDSPREVGTYAGNKTIVFSSSGIGYRDHWRTQQAKYPAEMYKQVKYASKFWRDIAPHLSNQRDRTEKFRKLFSTFEDQAVKLFSKVRPNETEVLKWLRNEENNVINFNIELDQPIRWNGMKYRSFVIEDKTYVSSKKITPEYGSANKIPVDVPESNLKEWIDAVPYIAKALQIGQYKANQFREAKAKVIEEVEQAVRPWLTTNRIL